MRLTRKEVRALWPALSRLLFAYASKMKERGEQRELETLTRLQEKLYHTLLAWDTARKKWEADQEIAPKEEKPNDG